MTKMQTILSNEDRIIALSGNELYDTKTKIHLPATQLSTVVQLRIPGLNFVIANDCYPYVAELNQQHGWNPKWVCRFVARRKTIIRKGKDIHIGSFVPVYFGFKEKGKNRHRNIAYKYYCISTDDILNCSTRSSENYSIDELIEIATEILDLVKERTGNRSGTMSGGAIATRLMKASKEWSRDRKPASKFTNDFARTRLPGNHYSLSVAPGSNYKATTYLDQNNAHHQCAKTVAIPEPSSLRARGNYKSLKGIWLKNGTRQFRSFRDAHIGLIAASISVGHIPKRYAHLIPQWLQQRGTHTRFFYSNEWNYLTKWRTYCSLNYVVAAWTSTKPDTLVPEYASYALGRLDRTMGVAKKPIKSILLAGYGMLAVDSSKVSSNYYQSSAKGGKSVTLPRAGGTREINFRRRGFSQPSLRNVIARGIIEAETRKRSLDYACSLQEDFGIQTLCVYADGLIVDTDAVPFLAEGWKIQAYLHNVLFIHPMAFTSHEMTKIPGLPKDMRLSVPTAERVYKKRRELYVNA